MADTRPIRVLVAKPGLDGHDRGAKVIARALRDAGMEVIYTGIRQTPEMIVEAAIQEDVDAILMSILSGAHMAIFPKVVELLKQNGVDDVLVAAGGILPDEDIPAIKAMGIKGCFGPGTPTDDIIAFVRANIKSDRLTADVYCRCTLQNLAERLLSGDRRALARMVTLIENESPQARRYLAELHQHAGKAHIVGVTGAPGAGKSTLVTHIVRELRRRDLTVGVVAVHPTIA